MTERRLKRPRDPAQLAKLIVDIATGEVEDVEPPKSAKSRRQAQPDGPKSPARPNSRFRRSG